MGLISRSTVPYTKRRCLHTCKALGTLCSLHKANTLTVPGWQGGEGRRRAFGRLGPLLQLNNWEKELRKEEMGRTD